MSHTMDVYLFHSMDVFNLSLPPALKWSRAPLVICLHTLFLGSIQSVAILLL